VAKPVASPVQFPSFLLPKTKNAHVKKDLSLTQMGTALSIVEMDLHKIINVTMAIILKVMDAVPAVQLKRDSNALYQRLRHSAKAKFI
jgi:hypothetical protein